jgi:ankyrin repeat protein
VDVEDDEGTTAPHLACEKNNFFLVKLLLARKADVDKPKINGLAAIHLVSIPILVNVS